MTDANTDNKNMDDVEAKNKVIGDIEEDNKIIIGDIEEENKDNDYAGNVDRGDEARDESNSGNELRKGLNTGNEEMENPQPEFEVRVEHNSEKEVNENSSENRATEEESNEVRKELNTGYKEMENPQPEFEVRVEHNSEKEVNENSSENRVTEEESKAGNEVMIKIRYENGIAVSCLGICHSKEFKEKLEKDELFHNACYFAIRVSHYMKMLYDISKRGSSDKKSEDIKLRLIVKVTLRRSVDNYSTKYIGKFLPIADPENRSRVLSEALEQEMFYCCKDEDIRKIVTLSGLCFFAAFDLQEVAGFEEAVHCVTASLVLMLYLTKSPLIIDD